jgi:O-antigen/teichoic acid export membrane protein
MAKHDLGWMDFVGALLFVLIAAIVIPLVGVIGGGPIIGAWFIWAFVRWINCRSDPKHVTRPPDAP